MWLSEIKERDFQTHFFQLPAITEVTLLPQASDGIHHCIFHLWQEAPHQQGWVLLLLFIPAEEACTLHHLPKCLTYTQSPELKIKN